MKRKLLGILSSYCLLLLSQGCADITALPDTDEAVVPIRLCARGGAIQGSVVTRTEPKEAFTASVAFSTTQGNYTSLSDDEYEGVWKASVGAEGTMTWTSKEGSTTSASPFYPRYGAYLYLVAYSPQAVPTNGEVSYTLTGQEDLLYVKELQGNCWDGEKFSGNTQSDKDKSLTFNHLLTRLCFKACKKQADGLAVKITRITVNEALTQAVVPLATGVPAFSATTPGLSLTPKDGGKDVTGTTAVAVGNLMLPPLGNTGKYTLTVETSVGTFSNIEISYGGVSAADILKAGISHEVTLSIADKSLSITSVEVKEWTLVEAGDVEIGERN
ncbi:fimbrillin family protein [Bacteroides sp.]|uniref:fimbrillin family protein n=1 Tax=Bacteroides sp. TaxID=29523 RepID=UPI002622CE21|nr:fimbrillin family protein [Bacteroides sp.]